jgi:plastocyanin
MRALRACTTLMVALSIAAIVTAAPGGGTVTGKITYTGTPIKPKPIDMSKEPTCAKQHTTPEMTESVVTGAGNTLENVVVYVSAGGAGETTAPSTAVTFDQQGCHYLPHVLAFEVNQELRVVNSDQTSHNIHPLAKINQEWNKSQPPGTPPIIAKYEKPEFISVKCNIHPWMHGYFAVLKTPHYAVSDASGEYKLPNLPPGKYTLTAWQESYGTQTQEVTITGSESKSVDFSFVAKPY